MLTQLQLSQFEDQGYLVIDNVLDDAILKSVKQEYTALLDALYSRWHEQGLVPTDKGLDFWQKLLVSYRAGCDWFQPMDISLPGGEITHDTPFHFGPAVFDMINHGNLLDLVEELIGPEITSNPIQHVRLKPPAQTLRGTENRAHIMATDWHQDRAVAHAEGDQTKMITVWLAISDATEENGCLQVIPGKPQMFPHCPKKQTGIADGFIDTSKAVPLPVKAGGAVLFHPLTPHASLDNHSADFRWSFDIRYNVTGQPTGRSHFPDFVARSRADPSTELRDWRIWKRMWEECRTQLAPKPQIPIHRWSSQNPVCA